MAKEVTSFPQLTTTERNALTSVPTNTLILNTTTSQLELYNGATWDAQTGGGGGGSPGGADTNIQFNDSGAFGGNSGLVYDKTRKSVAIGASNTINADNSMAVGTSNTISSGADQSFASGNSNSIGGNTNNSHVEGYNNIIGSNLTTVHAEGNSNTVNGTVSHAEGYGNTTTGAADRSHVEGENSRTENVAAHAEGSGTKASGVNSHSEGSATTASGDNSHAAGEGTTAQGYAQTTTGRFNVLQGTSGSFVSGDESFIVGNGTSGGARHNAFSITNDSIVKMYGTTSGFFGQKAAATTTSYSVIWPSAQGAASTFLQNDGAGNLSWAAGGSGANTALSNLTNPTAINQDLFFSYSGGFVRTISTNDTSTGGIQSNQLKLKSGNSTGAGSSTGSVFLESGDGVQDTGNVFIQSGTSGSTFNSGSISLTSADVTTARSGDINLTTGAVASGASPNQSGGITNTTGAVAGANTVSGDWQAVTGNSAASNTGSLVLQSGDAGGNSGSVVLQVGAAGGTPGTINFAGNIGSSVIPSTASTFDLGASGFEWNNLYVSTIYAPGHCGAASIDVANGALLDLAGVQSIDFSGRTLDASNGATMLDWGTNSDQIEFKVNRFKVPATVTAGGTTGAQTINKMAGTVNFAAATSSLVVTNNKVSTTSLVFAVIRTNDATATIKNVVPASGSFTITLTAAATSETSAGFFVVTT